MMREKLQKLMVRNYLNRRLYNAYNKMYTRLFENLKKLRDLDLQRICIMLDAQEFW